MKVVVIANISVNGRVLLAENPNHQVPQEAIAIFMQIANQAGNLVVGKTTFELFQSFPGGAKGIFPGVEIVMLSATSTITNELTVVSNPEEAVRHLTEKGYDVIAVGGGTKTYNAFLDKDLVTDIYFNLIPTITGSGGILATNDELKSNFKLSGHTYVSDDILQLHLTRA